ncbi:sensor histidine kinase [Sphingomonas koreensis]|nr:sensor histidine kinase [Sphingomonas koreensis]
MRLLPRSLYGRLLVTGTLATLLALVVAGFAIGAVLERVVLAGLDQQLDGEIALLATAIGQDGTVDRAALPDAAPFDRPDSGWGWTITLPSGQRIASGGATPATLPAPRHPPHPPALPGGARDVAPPPPPPLPRDDARPFDWRDPATGLRHGRAWTIATAAGAVTIVATAPRDLIERPLRQALTPLLVSLLLLGAALTLATLVQLRLGLAPLGRLRRAIGAVRAGTASDVPDDQPSELAPLVRELNALFGENQAALANARAHAANLAHGLKTPLATLSLELAAPGRDPDGRLTVLTDRIEQAVRHHLGRARAATAHGPARVTTPLAAALDGLIAALSRLHAERGIAVTHAIAPDLALAVDPQDLDELLGNLLDNAWRWAGSAVAIDAVADSTGGSARITVADDGPGIPEAARTAALAPGRRLDERGDGHGFGLAITRELAELYGGSLALEHNPGGGLAAIVTLPLAVRSVA